MKNPMLAIATLLAFTTVFIACDQDEDPVPETKMMILHAHGIATATQTTTTVPGTGQEITGISYLMEFYDKDTGELLGFLEDVNVDMEDQADGSVIAEGYPTFIFKDDGSTLSLHNFVVLEALDAATMKATYEPAADEKNVIAGTGRFAGASGRSVLSATLDVSKMDEGTIIFDCIYTIILD